MPIITGILGGLKLVPRWVWYALAAALAWHFVIGWHKGQIRAHDRTVIEQRDTYWNGRIEAVAKQAQQVRADAERTSAAITEKVRTDHESQARIIASDAGSLRVRGPGASADNCRPIDHSSVSSGASVARPVGITGTAAGSEVPASDRASVPWLWLVNSAEQADLNRSEVLAWRSWYKQQSAAWEKMRTAKP